MATGKSATSVGCQLFQSPFLVGTLSESCASFEKMLFITNKLCYGGQHGGGGGGGGIGITMSVSVLSDRLFEFCRILADLLKSSGLQS